MTKKASAKAKTGAKAPATKKAPTVKKPLVKKASAKKSVISTKPLIEKVSTTPVAVEQFRKAIVERTDPAMQVLTDALASVAPAQVAKRVVKVAPKPVTTAPANPNEVKTRKTTVRPGDIAEGDTDKGGRFEVLVGSEKIGEVAFCSTVRMRDNQPSGFRRMWRGEDTCGTVLLTDGKRMKSVVELLVSRLVGER